jgi:Na+/proline symporter
VPVADGRVWKVAPFQEVVVATVVVVGTVEVVATEVVAAVVVVVAEVVAAVLVVATVVVEAMVPGEVVVSSTQLKKIASQLVEAMPLPPIVNKVVSSELAAAGDTVAQE